MIYWLFFGAFSLFAMIGFLASLRVNNFVGFTLFGAMILLAAVRENIGIDYVSYVYAFNAIPAINVIKSSDFIFEPITVLAVSSLKYFFCDLAAIRLSFGIIAILTIINTAKFARVFCGARDSLAYFMVLYLGFSYLQINFNVIRYGLAASFMLLAMAYIELGERHKSVLSIAISFATHSASLLILPALYLSKKSIAKYRLLLIYLFGFLIYYSGLTEILLPHVLDRFIDFKKVQYYFVDTLNVKYGLSLGFIFNSTLFFSSLFALDKNRTKSSDDIVINLMCFALFFYLIFNSYYVIIERMLLVLNISFLVYISRFPLVAKIRFSAVGVLIYGLFVVLYSGISFYNQLGTDGLQREFQYIPYETFLNF